MSVSEDIYRAKVQEAREILATACKDGGVIMNEGDPLPETIPQHIVLAAMFLYKAISE